MVRQRSDTRRAVGHRTIGSTRRSGSLRLRWCSPTQALPWSVFTHLYTSLVDGVICLDGSLPTFARAELDAPDVTERVVFACELMADSDLPFVRSVNRSEGA